jgi:hypothetical protein
MNHAAIGGFTGTLGAQLQSSEMSALGEEALFPKTKSTSNGIFLV